MTTSTSWRTRSRGRSCSGLDVEERRNVEFAALHDVGKIACLKRSATSRALDDEEWEIMRRHTTRSYRQAMPIEAAIVERGTQFDPEVVRALLTIA